jgi:hypothetical protein
MDYRTYHAINQFVYDHSWLGPDLSALETWAIPVIAVATFSLCLRVPSVDAGAAALSRPCASSRGAADAALDRSKIVPSVRFRL